MRGSGRRVGRIGHHKNLIRFSLAPLLLLLFLNFGCVKLESLVRVNQEETTPDRKGAVDPLSSCRLNFQGWGVREEFLSSADLFKVQEGALEALARERNLVQKKAEESLSPNCLSLLWIVEKISEFEKQVQRFAPLRPLLEKLATLPFSERFQAKLSPEELLFEEKLVEFETALKQLDDITLVRAELAAREETWLVGSTRSRSTQSLAKDLLRLLDWVAQAHRKKGRGSLALIQQQGLSLVERRVFSGSQVDRLMCLGVTLLSSLKKGRDLREPEWISWTPEDTHDFLQEEGAQKLECSNHKAFGMAAEVEMPFWWLIGGAFSPQEYLLSYTLDFSFVGLTDLYWGVDPNPLDPEKSLPKIDGNERTPQQFADHDLGHARFEFNSRSFFYGDDKRVYSAAETAQVKASVDTFVLGLISEKSSPLTRLLYDLAHEAQDLPAKKYAALHWVMDDARKSIVKFDQGGEEVDLGLQQRRFIASRYVELSRYTYIFPHPCVVSQLISIDEFVDIQNYVNEIESFNHNGPHPPIYPKENMEALAAQLQSHAKKHCAAAEDPFKEFVRRFLSQELILDE